MARRKYKPILDRRRKAAIAMQALMRGYLERRRFMHKQQQMTRKVVAIQSCKSVIYLVQTIFSTRSPDTV